MANTVQLPSLTTREAIQDAVYRCIVGIDTDDKALVDSAFMPDSVFDLNGKVMEGLPAMYEQMLNNVMGMDTLHMLTNFRINHEQDTASLTCSAVADHWKRGDGMQTGSPRLTSGSIYYVDLVRDGKMWKVKTFRLKMIYAQGDWGVFGAQ